VLTTAQALALLQSGAPVTYDVLDEVFLAFGFSSELELPNTTWYRHPRYGRCGDFRAKPLYDFSTLSREQVRIVLGMIGCVRAHQELERG